MSPFDADPANRRDPNSDSEKLQAESDREHLYGQITTIVGDLYRTETEGPFQEVPMPYHIHVPLSMSHDEFTDDVFRVDDRVVLPKVVVITSPSQQKEFRAIAAFWSPTGETMKEKEISRTFLKLDVEGLTNDRTISLPIAEKLSADTPISFIKEDERIQTGVSRNGKNENIMFVFLLEGQEPYVTGGIMDVWWDERIIDENGRIKGLKPLQDTSPDYRQQIMDGQLEWTGVVDLYLNGTIGMEEMMSLNLVLFPDSYKKPISSSSSSSPSSSVFEEHPSERVSQPVSPVPEQNVSYIRQLQRMAKEGGITIGEIESLHRRGSIDEVMMDELQGLVQARTQKRPDYKVPEGTVPGKVVHSPYDDEADSLRREFGTRTRLDSRRGEGNMVDKWRPAGGEIYHAPVSSQSAKQDEKPAEPMTQKQRLALLAKVRQRKEQGKADKKRAKGH